MAGLRLLLLAALLAIGGCGPGAPPPVEEGPQVADLLGGDADRFARALPGGTLTFPADHGAHPDYRSEWWYFTGNLATREGRHFGFQLTFFRFALSPDEPVRDSAWASRQIWMAHFAVSDPGAGRFEFRERLSRGALGLAGARTLPLAVWLDDWRLESVGEDFLPPRLVARDDGVEGWDWFALQLDDGTELMVYRLRRTDGSAAAHSAGTFVAEDGRVLPLAARDFELAPTRVWTSPASGVTYPIAWTIGVPSAGLELTVEPWQDRQEMNVSVRYWEGAIRVLGTRAGRPVAGNGYLELAGYRPAGASPERARPPR